MKGEMVRLKSGARKAFFPSPQNIHTHARMHVHARSSKERVMSEGFRNRPVEAVLSESSFHRFSSTNIIIIVSLISLAVWVVI